MTKKSSRSSRSTTSGIGRKSKQCDDIFRLTLVGSLSGEEEQRARRFIMRQHIGKEALPLDETAPEPLQQAHYTLARTANGISLKAEFRVDKHGSFHFVRLV